MFRSNERGLKVAFKGKKKVDYQRDYMRKRRLRIKKMLAERFGIPYRIPRVDADGYITPEYE